MRAMIAPGAISKNNASSVPNQSPTRLVWLAGCLDSGGHRLAGRSWAPATVTLSRKCASSKVAGMAYDVARVRGLHPSLGDGGGHFDAPTGMLIPDSAAARVSPASRRSGPSIVGAHPSAQRSAAVLEAARAAVADLFNVDPAGVVLGSDRAILLSSLAEASSSRAGLGYEVVVSRLDDEANIAPWLRAAHRYGAKVKWAEIDIETGELPTWQWEGLIGKSTRLVAVASASGTLGTVTDLRAMTKLVHDVGGLVVVDHSAAAPYRLLDVKETDADIVAVNALAWGGPPVGAVVFRDPALINSFSSVSTDPNATGPARLAVGPRQLRLGPGRVRSRAGLA